MPAIPEGTVEWFQMQRRAIVSHARALDAVASARRATSSLLANWDNPDPEIRAALHVAAVISYARPFSNNIEEDSRTVYPINRLKNSPGFDRALHDHLVDVRNKIIAHHDSEYLKARTLHATLGLRDQRGRRFEMSYGASVHVVSLHSIDDREIANKYASHFDAVLLYLNEALGHALTEMLRAAQRWPEIRRAAAATEESEILSLAHRGEAYELPGAHLAGLAQLPVPKLTVTPEGYVFRTIHYEMTARGDVSIAGPDGEITISLGPVPSK